MQFLRAILEHRDKNTWMSKDKDAILGRRWKKVGKIAFSGIRVLQDP